MTHTPIQQAAIKAILLQFNAEQHQGLNELAGHGTALDQAVKQFSELFQAAATQRAIEELENLLRVVPMPTLSYEQIVNRIAELKKNRVS